MAAPDLTLTRPGQADLSGDVDALFLKVFGNEVLTAFAETNVAMSRHTVRSIKSGKSAQFPATWKGAADYHTPGTMIVGSTLAANERVIVIDDLLVAPRSLASIDDAKNHYDVRSILTRDIGMALSKRFDQNVLRVMAKAARATATVTGGNGGTRIIDADFITTVADLEAGIFNAVQALDEKDVPEQDRYVFLKPDQYYALVAGSAKVIHSDFNPTPNGGYAQGKVFRIAGAEIVKTNNLPSTNVTTGPTAYRGNFTTVAALVIQKGAVGTVKLMDLAVEAEWLIQNQAWLMVGKYAVGHGILRPECAVELTTASTS